ncbi:MAG TPA: hypothetical protein QKA14_01015 [Candidatus Megaira endosymbiont of Hartmannula sinica]|nr:hypothetical protein [Candidatus Megaera endosymbiont of Hartmannula sinica]
MQPTIIKILAKDIEEKTGCEIISSNISTVRKTNNKEKYKNNYRNDSYKKLQLTIEKIDPNLFVSADDCKKISKLAKINLTMDEILSTNDVVEVISSGVDRELKSLSDYKKFKGRIAQINVNRSEEYIDIYIGKIDNVIDNHDTDKNSKIEITLKNEHAPTGKIKNLKINNHQDQKIIIDFDKIKKGKLVFSNKMLRDLLQQNKIKNSKVKS